MSSSKIFKQDGSFKPTGLVQEEILIPPDNFDSAEINTDKEILSGVDGSITQQIEPTAPETVPNEPAPSPVSELDIQAAQEEAFNKGFEEASLQYQQKLDTVLDAFSQSCQKLDGLHASLLEKHRGDIINTAISLSEKIINNELETGRDVIAATLEKALEQAIKSDEFIITIHPADLEAVESIQERLVSHINGLERIVLKTSSDIAQGGCILESNTCSVNASLPSQLENAREFLEENTLPLDQKTEANPSIAE